MNFIKKTVLYVSGASAAAASSFALAVPPDFTALTDGIDLSTVQAALLVAMVALLGLYLVKGGGMTIVSMFRGSR